MFRIDGLIQPSIFIACGLDNSLAGGATLSVPGVSNAPLGAGQTVLLIHDCSTSDSPSTSFANDTINASLNLTINHKNDNWHCTIANPILKARMSFAAGNHWHRLWLCHFANGVHSILDDTSWGNSDINIPDPHQNAGGDPYLPVHWSWNGCESDRRLLAGYYAESSSSDGPIENGTLQILSPLSSGSFLNSLLSGGFKPFPINANGRDWNRIVDPTINNKSVRGSVALFGGVFASLPIGEIMDIARLLAGQQALAPLAAIPTQGADERLVQVTYKLQYLSSHTWTTPAVDNRNVQFQIPSSNNLFEAVTLEVF